MNHIEKGRRSGGPEKGRRSGGPEKGRRSGGPEKMSVGDEPAEDVLELMEMIYEKYYKTNSRKLSHKFKVFFLMCIELSSPSNPVPIVNESIKLAPSPIHGEGVFATKLIKKGNFITFYPAHAAGFLPSEHNKEYIFAYLDNEKFPHSKEYMTINGHLEIYGNPNIKNDPLFLGHMINDSNKYVVNNDMSDIEIKNIVIRYYLESKNNAMFDSNSDETFHYLVAIRDIQPGEEILASYRLSYWIDPQVQERFVNKIMDLNFLKFIRNYLRKELV